jgi:hypothetical protein
VNWLSSSITKPRFFILVGDKDSWIRSLSDNIWGFSNRSVGNWNTSEIGDYLAFYVTSPFKKIIGYGRITSKFVSEELTWPDEIAFKKSIWRYRIRFNNLKVLENWEMGVPVPKDIMLNTGRKVIDEQTFSIIIKQL